MQVVLVGDSDGEVNVYLLKNTPTPPDDQVHIKTMYSCCNTYVYFTYSLL